MGDDIDEVDNLNTVVVKSVGCDYIGFEVVDVPECGSIASIESVDFVRLEDGDGSEGDDGGEAFGEVVDEFGLM